MEVVLENRPADPHFLRPTRECHTVIGYRGTESVAVARLALDGDLSGWTVEAEFRLDGGEVVHGPVTFRPADDHPVPFGNLTTTAYRRLSLHSVLVELEAGLSRLDHAFEGGLAEAGWIDAVKAGKNPGRRGQDERWFLEWARRRIMAQQVAPRRPIKWLVEQYPGYSEYAINEYIREARVRSLLTKASEEPGWGPRARQLLKGDRHGKR